MKLKEKLMVLRRERKLTQDDVAVEVGVTRQTVSRWERGVIAPSGASLAALSRLYGVPLEELASNDPPPGEGPPVAVAEEPPVREGAEATPLADGEAPGKRGWNIAARIGLAACLVLVTIAAVITIWSAVFKKPEEPKDKIIRTEDIEPEYIDPAEVQDWTDTTVTIKE